MSQYVDHGLRAFPVSGAIAQYSRVKVSSGQLAVAGATDVAIGVIRDDAFNAGEIHTVLLRSKSGTFPMIAAGAISAGVPVYSAASGQVSATQGSGTLVGQSVDSATAAGSIIEVIPAINM